MRLSTNGCGTVETQRAARRAEAETEAHAAEEATRFILLLMCFDLLVFCFSIFVIFCFLEFSVVSVFSDLFCLCIGAVGLKTSITPIFKFRKPHVLVEKVALAPPSPSHIWYFGCLFALSRASQCLFGLDPTPRVR